MQQHRTSAAACVPKLRFTFSRRSACSAPAPARSALLSPSGAGPCSPAAPSFFLPRPPSSSAQRTWGTGAAAPIVSATNSQGVRPASAGQGGPHSTSAISGRATARMSPHPASTRPAPGPVSSRSNSAATRSAATNRSAPFCARAAASVAGSMAKSSAAANRSARKMRSASSAKRSSGFPTQRTSPALRSRLPPKRSITAPSGPRAMALMVKSRRARSSARLAPSLTEAGRRWSV